MNYLDVYQSRINHLGHTTAERIRNAGIRSYDKWLAESPHTVRQLHAERGLYFDGIIIRHKDKEYEIDGTTLIKEVEITPSEAVLGTTKEIETLHGKISIKIPEKVSSGQSLRLKELGLPDKNGKYGDLKAKMKIVIPKDLSDEEIKLYKKLADLRK